MRQLRSIFATSAAIGLAVYIGVHGHAFWLAVIAGILILVVTTPWVMEQ